jgi:hypothetical protein
MKTLQPHHDPRVPPRKFIAAVALRSRDAGIHAEAGILAPEPWTARLQLRDSAGFAPDVPHFSLTPSDEALCCAFGCRGTLPRGPAVVKDACIARTDTPAPVSTTPACRRSLRRPGARLQPHPTQ